MEGTARERPHGRGRIPQRVPRADMDPLKTEREETNAAVPASASADEAVCANCGTALRGAFCHRCGQRRREGPLRFRDLGRQFVRTFLDLDQGLLYTISELVLHPGTVARRYVDGQRARFVGPLTIFLLAATLTYLAMEWYEDAFLAIFTESVGMYPEKSFQPGGVLYETFGSTSPESYAKTLLTYIKSVYSYVGILNGVIVAFVLRAFTRRWTVAELVVFELYVLGVSYTAIAAASSFLVSGVGPYLIGSHVIQLLAHGFAGATFFDSRIGGVFKAGLAYFIGMILYLGISTMTFTSLMIFR